MGPVDAFWHLSNFFGPALGLALIAPALAKLMWRRDLRTVAWRSLVAWTFGAGAAALLAGLVMAGRDGRMLSYAAMVLAAALALWWRGWARR